MSKVLACLAVLALPTPLFAQTDAVAAARAAAAELARVDEQLEASSSRRDQLAALTATVRAYEDGLDAVRLAMRNLNIRQNNLRAVLDDRSEEIERLLGALQTIGRVPAPILSLHPGGPMGAARTGMMLTEMTPALQRDVAALRESIGELQAIEAAQKDMLAQLSAASETVRQARIQLSEAARNREELPRKFANDPVKMALLTSSADSLDAFARQLEQAEGARLSSISPDNTVNKGALALPVQGAIQRGYREEDLAGVARPGWVIATQDRALVTAPSTATLRYNGPLLDYGTVVILEPAPDVLFVLSGLAEGFGEPGQILPAGAPVGLMPGNAQPALADVSTQTLNNGIETPQTLYLEVRTDEGPVDPATWFAEQKGNEQ